MDNDLRQLQEAVKRNNRELIAAYRATGLHRWADDLEGSRIVA